MSLRRIRVSMWGLAAIVAAVAVILGCEGDGGGEVVGGPVDDALVGHWTLTLMRVNGSGAFVPSVIGWAVELQLNADGSMSYAETRQGQSFGANGTWSASGRQVHIHADRVNWNGPYTVSGNTFTGTFRDYDGEGNDAVLTFMRR